MLFNMRNYHTSLAQQFSTRISSNSLKVATAPCLLNMLSLGYSVVMYSDVGENRTLKSLLSNRQQRERFIGIFVS